MAEGKKLKDVKFWCDDDQYILLAEVANEEGRSVSNWCSMQISALLYLRKCGASINVDPRAFRGNQGNSGEE